MTTTGRPPVALGSLMRPDGAVLVPPAVAGDVLRLVELGLTVRVRADGGELSPAARSLLFALHDANVRYLDGQDALLTMSEFGSSGSAQPSVELTVDQAAALLECTPRHVRRLVATGRVSGRRAGWAWLINAASLDGYRLGAVHEADPRPGRGQGPWPRPA
ncbi:excisionase family DNA binding protein [Streptomyces sp. 846.5]|nr:excisionase family DNA binding protein [Streptomyces sp. 846.5]